ncbi:receptor-like protein kinase [Seminavis robusta]|uniref:Circumsporozoite protein n=1 Tax=Seminavis robusta TaxID=568900 RepID=A0A9N8EPT7_9STRA|nr:receptor-like protein kinase [Seminavis robusta]|eukprot:Sro1623_g286650.1 receptor-like protein kinase (400) ;mRNA; f:15467-16666
MAPSHVPSSNPTTSPTAFAPNEVVGFSVYDGAAGPGADALYFVTEDTTITDPSPSSLAIWADVHDPLVGLVFFTVSGGSHGGVLIPASNLGDNKWSYGLFWEQVSDPSGTAISVAALPIVGGVGGGTPLEVTITINYSTPSQLPSAVPSKSPSLELSTAPSHVPSSVPSALPSSHAPSMAPSHVPSSNPTTIPTTAFPTSSAPSAVPSRSPSVEPSTVPSHVPSSVPSALPSSHAPSMAPSHVPSSNPTTSPTTAFPTSSAPSAVPSKSPSSNPTTIPTTSSPNEVVSFSVYDGDTGPGGGALYLVTGDTSINPSTSSLGIWAEVHDPLVTNVFFQVIGGSQNGGTLTLASSLGDNKWSYGIFWDQVSDPSGTAISVAAIPYSGSTPGTSLQVTITLNY